MTHDIIKKYLSNILFLQGNNKTRGFKLKGENLKLEEIDTNMGNQSKQVYLEEVQQHALQRNQQVPMQMDHMQQEQNYGQDGEKPPVGKLQG